MIDLDAAHREYEQLVERDWRHNMRVFAAWEFLWGFGMPFAMFITFAPAYLGALGAQKWLIGFVIAFPTIFAAGQMLVSYIVPPRRRLGVYRIGVTLSLLPWLTYSAASFFWGAAWPRAVHCVLYVLVMLVFIGVCNMGSCIYWEMMTDNIPPRRRGFLFGLRTAGIGTSGVAMGYVASRVLAHWETPRNFQAAFVIGGGFFLVSCVMLWRVRDHVNPDHSRAAEQPHEPFFLYLRGTVQKLWQEPNYRIFLFFFILLAIAANGAAFMVPAAREQLHVNAQEQGVFSLIYLGVTAGLGWVIGMLADRFGYRLVALLCGLLLSGAFGLCLLTRHVVFWYLAYGAFTMSTMSGQMILCNMSAELCPEIAPNRLMAVGNVLVMMFVMIASTLFGAVVDLSGQYSPLFIANLVLCLVSLFGFVFIVREPRTGERYLLKTLPRA